MRKILVTAAFAVTLALGSVVSPAAAQPAEPADQANCVGDAFSFYGQAFGSRFGAFQSTLAKQTDGIGQSVGPAASSNCADL